MRMKQSSVLGVCTHIHTHTFVYIEKIIKNVSALLLPYRPTRQPPHPHTLNQIGAESILHLGIFMLLHLHTGPVHTCSYTCSSNKRPRAHAFIKGDQESTPLKRHAKFAADASVRAKRSAHAPTPHRDEMNERQI